MNDLEQSSTTILSSGAIFISYRRNLDGKLAHHIADRLAERYGRGSVFFDLASIEPGEVFSEVLWDSIDSCQAGLVMIGPDWEHAEDEKGKSRLWSRRDILRKEVERLLARETGVLVPVLLDDARMPVATALPKSLARICRLEATRCRSGRDFESDIASLISFLDEKLCQRQAGSAKDGDWARVSLAPAEWNVANHKNVREAFFSLLKPAPAKKVLLLRGDRGCGKTAVTAELASYTQKLEIGRAHV